MKNTTEKIEIIKEKIEVFNEFDCAIEYSDEYYERYIENFEPNNKKRPIYKFFKRTFDIVASLSALIISSPILLIIAIAIKCDSKGSVLFKQKRKTFQLFQIQVNENGRAARLRDVVTEKFGRVSNTRRTLSP